MAAADFPTSPSVGQTYTANGLTWEWDGVSWLTQNAGLTGTVQVNEGGTSATDSAGARANLGLEIGTDVQGWSADLDAIDALAGTTGYLKKTALNTWTLDTSVGSGTVTSVSGTGTVSGLTLTGTVTTSGSLTLGGTLAVTPSNFASQTANTILAAPNGSAGAPTFRALVAADIPTLNQNTTGTASNVTGTVAIANGGTGKTTAVAAQNALQGYTTTAKSAGTTVLTNASTYTQEFTGASTHTVQMPDATTVTLGWSHQIINRSTQVLTVRASEGSFIYDIPAFSLATVKTVDISAAVGNWWAIVDGFMVGTVPVANGGTGAISLTGLIKGNGTAAMTAAVAGTDYLAPAAIGSTVQAYDADLGAIAALAGTSGLLKKTAANTWTLDTTAYTANTGTVTSVGGTGTVSGLTLSGTVTTSGNLTLGGTLAVTASNFASQTANTFLCAPNGSAGVPTFRAIVAADIPTLNQNTTGNAATATTATNATQVNSTAQLNGYAISAAAITYNGAGGPMIGQAQGSGAAMLSFHRPSVYGVNLGLDTDNVLKVGGWSMGAVSYPILHSGNVSSYAATSQLSRGTVVTASGTAVDFTGLPAGIKRIVVVGKQLSLNSTGYAAIQIGTSGGIDATGYIWMSSNFAGNITSTTRFASAVGGVAVYYFDVIWTLYNIGGNDWVCALNGQESATYITLGAGTKTLSGTLDRVRVTSTTGTDTFDSGTINIFYEV